MMIFLFIIITVTASLVLFRLLAPEMYVRLSSRPRLHFPWVRPHLVVEELPPAIDLPMQPDEMPVPVTGKLDKMDALLLEKNKLIDRMQTELEAERSHRLEFEKVRSIMDEEIQRLKEQLKSLKQNKEQTHA